MYRWGLDTVVTERVGVIYIYIWQLYCPASFVLQRSYGWYCWWFHISLNRGKIRFPDDLYFSFGCTWTWFLTMYPTWNYGSYLEKLCICGVLCVICMWVLVVWKLKSYNWWRHSICVQKGHCFIYCEFLVPWRVLHWYQIGIIFQLPQHFIWYLCPRRGHCSKNIVAFYGFV